LHDRYGREVPGVWVTEVTAEPPALLPSGWYEEDTVLGELLRVVQRYQEDEHEPIAEVDEFLADIQADAEMIELLRIKDPRERADVLRRVAVYGVDMLRGPRVLSEEL
jgi:hypothetical protein